MFKNYLKVAVRMLMKNRVFSFINIFGLGMSMSVGMMVMLRLQDQVSYDNYHPDSHSTYRILSEYTKKSGEHWKMASTPFPLYQRLHDFTSIEKAVSIAPAYNGKAIAEGKELNIDIAFTEPSFFKVFGFSLSAGNQATCLQKPDAIVISKSTADRYFGYSNPLGKILTLESGKNFIVSGILNEPPGKSHIHHDAYVSINAVPQFGVDKSADWYDFNKAYTYVVLKKGFSETTFKNELKTISTELNKENKEGRVAFGLQSINKITPGGELLYNDNSGSSWSKFYFEIGVALIILLAACFNYTNLTIAKALTRAKEVGLRKINGATRSQVFLQYIMESVVLSLLALVLAWVLLSFIIRYAPFNDDYEFIPSSFQYNSTLVTWSVIFALFTGLIAGASPAWILSSFKPLRVLNNLKTAKILGKVSLQKTLIVFQYSLSLTIIIFLFAFYRQFSHLAAADPGFKKENVLVVPLNGLDEKIVAQQLSEIPGVHSSSAMSGAFSKHFDGMNIQVWLKNKNESGLLNYYYADASFIQNMGLEFIAGRNFSSADQNNKQSIIVNEQAVKAMGIQDPRVAIGQQLWISDTSKLEIAGVVKNFHYENAGKSIAPLAFRTRNKAYRYLYLYTDPSGKTTLIDHVKRVMSGLAPAQTFDAGWLDKELSKSNSQTATISLLGYLAFMAIAIASLGLLGLVIHTVEVKRKEISIRKIIGASSEQIVQMLSKGFIKLLFIAGVIAMPIGYTAGYLFLQNFADRIPFGIGGALLCYSILLLIGLITIISQTYKAAVENPAKSLRTE